MRQRDWRTVGGLVVIGLAVWIAVWLLGLAEGGGGAAHTESVTAPISPPAASGVAPSDDAEPAAPAALVDARTASAAASVEADWPGDALHLTGRVVDTQQRPVPDALVTHWPTEMQRSLVGLSRRDTFESGIDWSRVASTRTDADGGFVLDVHDRTLERHALGGSHISFGLFSDSAEARPILLTEHPAHATLATRVTAERAGDVDVGTIVLAPGATLTGQLVDPNGRAVAGVALSLELEESRVEEEKRLLQLQLERVGATSDAAGRFRITGLWPGTFSLETLPTAFAPLTRQVVIAGAGVMDLGNVQLSAGGHIAGIVLDQHGQPLPGAQVRVRPGFGADSEPDGYGLWDMLVRYGKRAIRHDTVAGADGRFLVTGLWDASPTFQVLARTDGFDPGVVAKVAAGTDDVVLSLEPQAVWRLTVVDATSHEPVLDAQVFGLRGASGWSYGSRIASEVDGDAYLLRSAGRERTLVVVSAPGHALQSFALPGLAAGAHGEQTLSLLREAVLAGRVVDDDHQPLPGAIVNLQPPDDLHSDARQLFADAQGRFRFAGLGAGEWSIETAAHGCVPTSAAYKLPLQDEEVVEDLELVLLRGGTITGVVLCEEGEAVTYGWVFAESKSPEAITASTLSGWPQDATPATTPWKSVHVTGFTDEEGRFTLAGVAPGEWHVDGQKGAEATVTLTGRESVDVVLKRPQPPRVTGLVTREGQAVAGALVELGWGPEIGSDWQALASTHTDAGGTYLLEHATDQACYVRALADGCASRAQPVQMAWEQTQQVDIALPTGRVRGRVIDAATGAPAAGVPLQLGDPARLAKGREDVFGQATTSAPDGTFLFEPVGAGTWLIRADHKDWCVARSGAIQVVERGADPDVTIALQRGGTVEIDFGGNPSDLSGRVTLKPLAGQGEDARSNGKFKKPLRYARLAPGPWQLLIERREGETNVTVKDEQLTVEGGQTLQVHASLEP